MADYRIADGRRFVANLEDELRHAAAGRPPSVLDRIEGSDASGTVYCLVRLDGRPERVDLTDGWWDGPELAADALAALRSARPGARTEGAHDA